MKVELVSNKILDAVLESLSIEELEAIIARKKREIGGAVSALPSPKPMSEKEKMKHHYLNVLVSMGIIYPPED